MSNNTLGPVDGRNSTNGRPSLSGEKACIEKANLAWPETKNRAKLLQYPKYVRQGTNGKLEFVRMDSGAPAVVRDFFQTTAKFNAYINPGSKPGKEPNAAAKVANKKNYFVDTQEMVITAY